MKTWLKITLIALFLAACGGGYARLRGLNRSLQPELAAARAAEATVQRQRAENVRLKRLIEQTRIDDAGARRELDEEIARARSDVAALEQRALERRNAMLEKNRADEEALERNRDLTKGAVLVENCANVGRATPVDAFQTLVWAVMKGDDVATSQLVGVTGEARERFEEAIAKMSEGVRAQFPTPERIAGLFVADMITNVASAHVVKQTSLDPQHTLLEIANLAGKTFDVPMELSPDGWRVSINSASAAKKIRNHLLGTAAKK